MLLRFGSSGAFHEVSCRCLDFFTAVLVAVFLLDTEPFLEQRFHLFVAILGILPVTVVAWADNVHKNVAGSSEFAVLDLLININEEQIEPLGMLLDQGVIDRSSALWTSVLKFELGEFAHGFDMLVIG